MKLGTREDLFTTDGHRWTQMKDKYNFTMKEMKLNLGAPVGGPSLCISPLATNASPLDHARRAAGGELG